MSFPLFELPIEIRAHIFKMSKRRDLVPLCVTNKDVYEEVKTVLWRSVFMDWNDLAESFSSRSKCLPYANTLRFCGRKRQKKGKAEINEEDCSQTFASIIQQCNASKLKFLSVNNYLVNDGLKLASENIRNMDGLSFRYVQVPSSNWNCLCNFKYLTYLKIFVCSNVEDYHFEHIGELKSLRILRVTECELLTGQCLDYFGEVTALTSFTLRGSFKAFRYLKPVPNLINLKEMDFDNTEFTDKFFVEARSKLKKIVLLDVSRTGVTDVNLRHISSLISLKTLVLGECDKITNTGILHVTKLPSLTHLDVWGCQGVTDVGLHHISQMKSLQSLDIGSCPSVTDVGISHLCTTVSLRNLKAGGCTLSQESISFVVSCLPLLEDIDMVMGFKGRRRHSRRRGNNKKKKNAPLSAQIETAPNRQVALSLGHFVQFGPVFD